MYIFTDVLRADIQISGEDIYHKLCNLDFNNTPVDILVFFKETAQELSKLLAVLFRTGIIPNDLLFIYLFYLLRLYSTSAEGL